MFGSGEKKESLLKIPKIKRCVYLLQSALGAAVLSVRLDF
jgi:hypothetical protein